MRLATIRTGEGTRAVRIDEDWAIELGPTDLIDVLRQPNWREWVRDATGTRHDLCALDFAPLVLAPEKFICVGLNYRNHILEMGRGVPEHPTLFAKFSGALIGARDPIRLPAESTMIDWEAELGIVIGSHVRAADTRQARAAIAGVTVVNDVTARDYQHRTVQWLQGKTFEATTPIGPWLVTVDDDGADMVAGFDLSCAVDGEIMQSAHTSELVFDPVWLIEYISRIIPLVPGDVIATGTPGGVGHARNPARYLDEGMVVRTVIDGIGECRNVCRRA